MPTSDTRSRHKNQEFISERTLTLPFPSNDITIKCYNFQLAKYQNKLFSEFTIPLPESIENAVPKRQAEFLAGRYSAISALKALGLSCNNIAIGKNRNPVWPRSIIASITHTTTTSICAASYKDSYLYLGIDIEYIIPTKLVTEIKSYIINIDEEVILRKCSLNFLEAFTLTFSAKESLFKALYPSVGYYFDFSAANITQVNSANNSFILVLTKDLTAELTAGIEFTGFFDCIEQQILTLIAQ
jgi:4'-phosphopantetheinyl transferase EntD